MKKSLARLTTKSAKGIGLMELVVTMVISIIPVSLVGILLVSGQQNWHQTYKIANSTMEVEAQAATVIFGQIGRKSDRNSSSIFLGKASPALSTSPSGNTLVYGDNIEFKYWTGQSLKKKRKFEDIDLLTPTESAYFYLDKNKLKIDYSHLKANGLPNKPWKTVVIANNVINVQFSRSTANNVELPTVRMKLTLKEDMQDVDSKTISVSTATLMRN
jgi:signal peptidase I